VFGTLEQSPFVTATPGYTFGIMKFNRSKQVDYRFTPFYPLNTFHLCIYTTGTFTLARESRYRYTSLTLQRHHLPGVRNIRLGSHVALPRWDSLGSPSTHTGPGT
jgi:hypothetical protein